MQVSLVCCLLPDTVECLGHMEALSTLVSAVTAPLVYTDTTSVVEVPLTPPISLLDFVDKNFPDDTHSDQNEMEYKCSFDLCFPDS